MFHKIIIFAAVRPFRALTRAYEHNSLPFALTTSIVMPCRVRLLGSLLAATGGSSEECFCGRDLHWGGQGWRHNGRPKEMRFIKTEFHVRRHYKPTNLRWSVLVPLYIDGIWNLVKDVLCVTYYWRRMIGKWRAAKYVPRRNFNELSRHLTTAVAF